MDNIKGKLNKYLANAMFIAMVVVGLVVAGGFVYGAYWLAKTGSYSFFYEDMVIKTIVQQVKPDALK